MTLHPRTDKFIDLIPQEWFDLNYRLQEEAVDANINEVFLVLWIVRLRAMIDSGSKCFGLFMARINELALCCAARYADCCELNAACQILFGRRVFFPKSEGWSFHTYGVNGRNCCGPFVESPADSEDGIHLFQNPAQSAEESRPLIPLLSGLLEDLGYLSEEYIMSVHRRIRKIKEVIGTFAEQGICSCEELTRKLSLMDCDEKTRFRQRGCLFNMVLFNDLGRELHLFMGSRGMKSKYLK